MVFSRQAIIVHQLVCQWLLSIAHEVQIGKACKRVQARREPFFLSCPCGCSLSQFSTLSPTRSLRSASWSIYRFRFCFCFRSPQQPSKVASIIVPRRCWDSIFFSPPPPSVALLSSNPTYSPRRLPSSLDHDLTSADLTIGYSTFNIIVWHLSYPCQTIHGSSRLLAVAVHLQTSPHAVAGSRVALSDSSVLLACTQPHSLSCIGKPTSRSSGPFTST